MEQKGELVSYRPDIKVFDPTPRRPRVRQNIKQRPPRKGRPLPFVLYFAGTLTPGWQPRRRPRWRPPWGCCPCRSGPSSPHARPRCLGAACGPCRRRKPRRSIFCRSPSPIFYRCRQPGAGSGWGW